MYRILPIILLSGNAFSGAYIELGLGVPLSPETGYIPDNYGIASVGYIHSFDKLVSLDLGIVHRSLTGEETCNDDNCYGDNAVEAKLRLEW